MFWKQATLKTKVTEIRPENLPFLHKTAAKHWTDVTQFPQKYQELFNNYVVANRVHIGDYNPEFKYYRVIALHGDVPNDNGDLWWWGDPKNPEEPELLRFDKSANKHVFETFNGRGNFKNHENDDVTKAVGIILDAAPNYEGKFIEALIAVDSKKDPDLVRGIEAGYIDSVSMGCLCGHSICTVCGHKATNEYDYCDHLKYMKGQTISYNGELVKVAEDNRQVNFIELSWVTVPADQHAKLLEKVAKNWNIVLSANNNVLYSVIQQALADSKMISSPEEYQLSLIHI